MDLSEGRAEGGAGHRYTGFHFLLGDCLVCGDDLHPHIRPRKSQARILRAL